ncbi:MAG: transglycosylase domain-containing protein, partial [Desulfobulbales bacterium]
PEAFINAIIAAEDNNFFKHFGVDIPGVMRAMLENIKAGKLSRAAAPSPSRPPKTFSKEKTVP